MITKPPCHRVHATVRRGAFTLLEMMVAVSILVVIIFTLTAMFNQTQRAFRGGVRQVDVMEAGRAAMDIIAYEVRQMDASGALGVTNYVQSLLTAPGLIPRFVQDLPDDIPLVFESRFTNELQEFFFLAHARDNNFFDVREWQGNGFFVHTNVTPAAPATNGPGTLYRIRTARSTSSSTRVTVAANTNNMVPTNTAVFRICEGVTHFKIRPLRADGSEIFPGTSGVIQLTGDNLPHYLDIELGLIDPPLLERVRGLPTAQLLLALTNQGGAVHMFRQTIPIPAAIR